MAECRNCGSSLKGDEVVCPRCNQKLNKAEAVVGFGGAAKLYTGAEKPRTERAGATMSDNAGAIKKSYLRYANVLDDVKLFKLAIMNYEGLGVEQNRLEAFGLFKACAERGGGEAQFWVGKCYEYGEGTAKSLAEAYRWYSLAASGGNVAAKIALEMRFTDFAISSSTAPQPEKVIEKSEKSGADPLRGVLRIRATTNGKSTSMGTGFMLQGGLVMTCAHCILDRKGKPYSEIAASFDKSVDDVVYLLDLVSYNAGEDIAMLRFVGAAAADLRDREYLNFGAAPAVMGDKIHTIADPDGVGLSYFEGSVSQVTPMRSGDSATVKMMTTLFALPGSSGAPIFNQQNKVVGMLDSDTEQLRGNICFGIPLENLLVYIIKLVKEIGNEQN